MTWKGERYRHGLAAKGISTNSIKYGQRRVNNTPILYKNKEVGFVDLIPTSEEYSDLYFEYYDDLKNTLTISYMEIYDNYKRQGLATAMLKKIEEENKDKYSGLFLRIDEYSEVPVDELIQFYQRAGFRVFVEWDENIFMLKRWIPKHI